MTPREQEKCEKYQKHFSELLDIDCKIVDVPENAPPRVVNQNERSFCARCVCDRDNELRTHLYGCHEAHRWNGRYVYYCPLGLTFIAASISGSSGDLAGGLVLGPIAMGETQDVLADLPEPKMAEAVKQLKEIPPEDVQHISEILAVVTAHISGVEHQKLQNLLYDQEKILKEIYVAKDYYEDMDSQSADMLLEFEKDLRIAVLRGEKTSALQMLNEMLAHIYIYSNFDISAIKARLLELLVILSRATIEAGADPTGDVPPVGKLHFADRVLQRRRPAGVLDLGHRPAAHRAGVRLGAGQALGRRVQDHELHQEKLRGEAHARFAREGGLPVEVLPVEHLQAGDRHEPDVIYHEGPHRKEQEAAPRGLHQFSRTSQASAASRIRGATSRRSLRRRPACPPSASATTTFGERRQKKRYDDSPRHTARLFLCKIRWVRLHDSI
jgi:ligand-binding sensor protein